MQNPITRREKLLKSIVDGQKSSITPITRQEQYLAYIAGESNTKPEHPITREESYLDKVASGGSAKEKYNGEVIITKA